MNLIKKPPPVDFTALIGEDPKALDIFFEPDVAAMLRQAEDKYLHWDEFRWRPLPEGMSHHLAWSYLSFQRMLRRRPVPAFRDENGEPFSYALPDSVLRTLSLIDRWSGTLIGTEQPGNLPSPERYVISSLMDEAIASSQLEGAATTRPVAKEMLRSGRKPQNHSEKMIYNNWVTIQHLREQKTIILTPQGLCEIHAMITQDTLENPADAGRIRTQDDIVVQYRDQVVHEPPKAALLPERVAAFCAFVNNDEQDEWLHPVVKASIIHFWIGYDHPFVDGNGRTARALFYWYLLSRNYWLFEYLVMSRYFIKAPARYVRAYMYTETDSHDLTYFIVYNLRIVRLAIQELRTYLQHKQKELADADELLRKHDDLNDRQRSLLAHALRHPHTSYTIQSHKNVHNVVYQTARTDLFSLRDRGLLKTEKQGRTYVFVPSDMIMAYLRQKQPT